MTQARMRNSINGLNVNAIEFLAERMSIGEMSVLNDIQASYLEELQRFGGDEDGKIDLILAARKMLEEEFGGIAL